MQTFLLFRIIASRISRTLLENSMSLLFILVSNKLTANFPLAQIRQSRRGTCCPKALPELYFGARNGEGKHAAVETFERRTFLWGDGRDTGKPKQTVSAHSWG